MKRSDLQWCSSPTEYVIRSIRRMVSNNLKGVEKEAAEMCDRFVQKKKTSVTKSSYPVVESDALTETNSPDDLRGYITANLRAVLCYDTSFASALEVFESLKNEDDVVYLNELVRFTKLSNDAFERYRNCDLNERFAAWQRYVAAQFLCCNFQLIAGQSGNAEVIELEDLKILEQNNIFRSCCEPSWHTLPKGDMSWEDETPTSVELWSLQRMLEIKLDPVKDESEYLLKVIASQTVNELSGCSLDTTVILKTSDIARFLEVELHQSTSRDYVGTLIVDVSENKATLEGDVPSSRIEQKPGW